MSHTLHCKANRRFRVLLMLVLLSSLSLSANPLAPSSPTSDILYASPTPSGHEDCTSWANACYLKDALTTYASYGDRVYVSQGVHFPNFNTGSGWDKSASFAMAPGVEIYGGFDPASGADLFNERDWLTYPTVLSGDIDGNDLTDSIGVVTGTVGIGNSYHVVTSSAGVTETAVLDGFIITGGNAWVSPPNSTGGGMYITQSNPTLTRLRFSGNHAAEGGGMAIEEGNPSLGNLVFSHNTADLYGGGLYIYQSSPSLSNLVFSENQAALGGGMYNTLTNVTMANLVFNGNQASSTSGGNGGGIYNSNSSPTLVNLVFSGNHAIDAVGYYGGNGGGMYNSNSSPTLVNLTFSGNHASSSDLSGGNGGGMYNHGSSNPQVSNTILWGNAATNNGDQVYNYLGGTPVFTHTLVQGGIAGLGTDGGGNIDIDPDFVRDPDAGDNDWTTLDDNDYGNLRLESASPAIDAGDESLLPADAIDLDNDSNVAEPTPLDLDGKPRVIDLPSVDNGPGGLGYQVDLGAHETGDVIFLPLVMK